MRELEVMKNKSAWMGPITVTAFVMVLAMMYVWAGDVTPGSEGKEAIEAEVAAALRVKALPSDSQLINQGQFPAGIGNDQIQLIKNPPIPVPADNGANSQAVVPQNNQLAHQIQQFPAGIGNDQIQLINNPPAPVGANNPPAPTEKRFPAGIGNDQIQLIDTTLPSGLGNQQMRLIKQTRLTGPYLGLALSDVPAATANEFNLAPGAGCYITTVVSMSPAQKSGLRTGDVILKFDGKDVAGTAQLAQMLSGRQPGDVVKIVFIRDAKKQSAHVKIENPPLGLNLGRTQNPGWIGADIQDIDAVMVVQFNLPDKKGVIISYVAPGSPAEQAGLQNGDVIKRLGAARIRDVQHFQSLVSESKPGQTIRLNIFRAGQYQDVDVAMAQQSLAAPNIPQVAPADVTIEGAWIGMDVSELSAKDVGAMGLPAGTKGILVADVEGPPASVVGFQADDVIISINGAATPDINSFVNATKRQTGAVVGVIRGGKHLMITVPPAGFTQQGTKLNTGLDKKFSQVAMTTATAGRIGIFAESPDLNAGVTGNSRQTPYLMVMDLNKNAYASLGQVDANNLKDAFERNNISALICTDISKPAATELSGKGIVIYSGVVGPVSDALGLYEGNGLIAMKGF
ncbi:MAG: PDZ domain-containing protein [Deltaproteobacteria bacterium]|nr:PDZ domain-containing protein [Deltaproteobacteria bacterium]